MKCIVCVQEIKQCDDPFRLSVWQTLASEPEFNEPVCPTCAKKLAEGFKKEREEKEVVAYVGDEATVKVAQRGKIQEVTIQYYSDRGALTIKYEFIAQQADVLDMVERLVRLGRDD